MNRQSRRLLNAGGGLTAAALATAAMVACSSASAGHGSTRAGGASGTRSTPVPAPSLSISLPRPVPEPITTTPASRALTNCDLLSASEVEHAFGVTIGAPHIDSSIGWCVYQAKDAATGGFSFRVSYKPTGGLAYYRQLRSNFMPTNTDPKPGQSVLISDIGDMCYYAVELGGAWDTAAAKGDVEVDFQIGGSTFQDTVDQEKAGEGLRTLMTTALHRAATGTPAN